MGIMRCRAGAHLDGNGLMRVLVIVLFLVLAAIPGQAQTARGMSHGEWEASVFGGGSLLGSGLYNTPVSGSAQRSSRGVGLRFGTGPYLGVRLTDNRWQRWGAAVEYSYSNQPISFTNLSDSIPSLGLGHAIHRFSYEILYHVRDRRERLRPFVFAGPGVSLFYVKGSAKQAAAAQGIRLSDPWKFAMSWGGGMKYLLIEQVALSVQFSDSISGVPRYGLPTAGNVVGGQYIPGFHPDSYLHNWLISAGFIYQWAKR